jgi:hypothetical protein
LLRELELGLQSGDSNRYLQLITPDANRSEAQQFAASWFETRITRAAVRERDRQPLPDVPAGTGYELNVDIFLEFGREGRLGTWRLDVRRAGSTERGDHWLIAAQQEYSAIEGLHQLQLNTQKQFFAADLTITAEDLELRFPAATVFTSEVPAGTTAIVVMGRGEMTFAPAPDAEQGQVRIFTGSNFVKSRIDAAFVRFNPAELDRRITGVLQERPVDPRKARRASGIFSEEVSKSYALDLRDLSPDLWSTIPIRSDFVAEIQTSRHDTLTYTRFSSDPEDISLFDRRRRRTISLYASEEKLSRRGQFYSEDDLVDYDVLHYDVEARFQPDREWIDGRTGLRLAIKAAAIGSFNLRLARELTLDSVVSRQFGRLLALRGLNQNTIIVQLPEIATRGTVLDIVVSYAGRLAPQAATREAVMAGTQGQPNRPPVEDTTPLPAEPSWLYSHNSLWYAQSAFSDYATARLRLSVPNGWESVASGSLAEPTQLLPQDERGRGISWRQSTFVATQPARYLSWTISRFEQAAKTSVSLNPASNGRAARFAGMGLQKLDLHTVANARQLGRGREVATRAVPILAYYGSLLGDFPYPTLTLAIVENDLPGGHSPPYFAQLHQPPPMAPVLWRNDPVFFSGFPDFFLAHEVAHQWWGQAVGWRNFHEQWLSEGFAQYFAVLYAQAHKPEAFAGILRQLRRWSVNESDQGPVYLGYRLGHIKGDSRVFRALVYDKGAAVLHMLRRLVGDDAFFRGVRRFYTTWRFRKAGTEDLRAILETESQQRLDRFFAGWIYGQRIPEIRFDWQIEGNEVVLRFDQLGDEVFIVPVTVSLQFADRSTHDELVVVDYKRVDVRLPLTGTLRSIDVNRDEAALAAFVR